jgi:hypothetical protein
MKAKTAFLGLVSLIALPAFAGATPTLGSFYNLTFYIEPNLAAGTSYCITFTTSGSVLSYKESGTYVDSTGAISGTWYINGDEVMLAGYGVTFGDDVPMVGRLIATNSKFAGRFLDYGNSSGEFYAGGTFIASKVASCPAEDADAIPHKGPVALN